MLTVIMPVFEEADQISGNVTRVHSILADADIDHQFLLVDDGSMDNTWDEICKTTQALDNVAALRLSRNFGKESAICAALQRCTGDAALIIDSDLQHPPELIPEMVRLWREEGYQVVEGVKQDRGREGVMSKLFAGLFYRIFRRLTGIDIGVASDFKLLDKTVVDAWRTMPEIDTFFRGMSAWLGFRHVQVPFTVAPRAAGRSKWSFRKLLRLAANSITAYTATPLYIVAILGAILMIGALVLFVQTLINKLLGIASGGFTTVIILQLLIGSCVMLSLGIIGVYLSKIYEETKRRPRFVVCDVRKPGLMEQG